MRADKKSERRENIWCCSKTKKDIYIYIYIYYDQLMFLENIANPEETRSSFPLPQEDVPHTVVDNECNVIIDP
jgi:hypothetical protein